jgi:hypothetical protein
LNEMSIHARSEKYWNQVWISTNIYIDVTPGPYQAKLLAIWPHIDIIVTKSWLLFPYRF